MDKEVIPPWIFAPGYEPARAFWRQDGELWFNEVWVPFWNKLDEKGKADYLEKWKVPDVWRDFSIHINPEFKKFLDSSDEE